MQEQQSGTNQSVEPPKQSKKVYEPPQIIYRAPLEAMAAVCTPSPPGKDTAACAVLFS